jgi:hypothetical protein
MGRRDIPHKICLRHGQVSGNYVLIIDGIVQVKGYSPVTDRHSFPVTFVLAERDCTITIDGRGRVLTFEHTLTIAGEVMPELRQVVEPLLHEKFPTKITAGDVVVVRISFFARFLLNFTKFVLM